MIFTAFKTLSNSVERKRYDDYLLSPHGSEERFTSMEYVSKEEALKYGHVLKDVDGKESIRVACLKINWTK